MLLAARVLFFAMGLTFLLPHNDAAGKRGFLDPTDFGVSDRITYIADLPDEYKDAMAEMTGTEDALIGFVYRRIGVLGFDLWSWNGRYCLFDPSPKGASWVQLLQREMRYWELDEAQAALLLDRAPSELRGPTLYRSPAGLLAMTFVCVFVVPYAIFSRARDRRIQQVRRVQIPPVKAKAPGGSNPHSAYPAQ